jgi:hypothetical protein
MKRFIRLALICATLLVLGLGCRPNLGPPHPPVKAESKDILKGMSDQEILDKIKPKGK